MEKFFDYDFSNKIIEYCFVDEPSKNESISLDEIIDSSSESIMIYDTNDYVLPYFLKCAEKVLNDGSRVIVGLVSDNQIAKLKTNGVNGGFFRSTSEKCNAAIIIVDKKRYFVAFDENHIFRIIEEKSLNEVFDYINYLIWTKTQSEYCKKRMSVVKDSRLSVVKPVIKYIKDDSQHKYATKSMTNEITLLDKEENLSKPAIVLNCAIKNAYSNDEKLYVNLFDDYYYPIENWESLIKSRSLCNSRYGELTGRPIWVNGKILTIKNEDSISKSVEKPLDEYKDFVPDYEAIAKEYKGDCKTLHIHVDVEPIKQNNSYHMHSNYKNLSDLEDKLNSNIDKLIKLAGDEKKLLKQLDSISSSRSIIEKINKYNIYIKETTIGEETLISKKNGFKEINVNESDIVIPSDILGKLLTKDKKNYFALKDESKIDDAKKWLKDNNLEAVLILGKEDKC